MYKIKNKNRFCACLILLYPPETNKNLLCKKCVKLFKKNIYIFNLDA